nr:HAD-IIA family hydrolase [Anaeromicropila herbilytica]
MPNNKKLYLLDIDGTIAFDNDLFDGTKEFMEEVKHQGGKYVFITNNSTKSIKDYMIKFTNLGIDVDETNFITSSYATALYLKENYKEELIFVLGTKSFIQELRDYGLTITEEIKPNIKVAVVGFDNELTYSKIQTICELLITRKIDYIATNPDYACPTSFGYVPDCGAICEFIEKAVKRMPIYVGKPNRLIVDMAMKATGYSREETLVIGDRLYTDIACGRNANVDTLVVFTGEAKLEDLEETEFKPSYYCDTIRDAYEHICTK